MHSWNRGAVYETVYETEELPVTPEENNWLIEITDVYEGKIVGFQGSAILSPQLKCSTLARAGL